MPTLAHELPLQVLRDNPDAVPELLSKVFGMRLPDVSTVEAEPGELTQCAPTEFRADQVFLLWQDRTDEHPAHAVVFESQTQPDDDKGFSWPVYMTTLRAAKRCGVTLVVFCADERTAKRASQPIDLGHPNWTLRVLTIGPAQTPVITDPEVAARWPGLSVLSAIHHAGDRDRGGDDVFRTMFEAVGKLGDEQASFYIDAVLAVVGKAASTHLETLMKTDATMSKYHSNYARTYHDAGKAEGVAEGEAKGEAKAVLTVLSTRGVSIPEQTRQKISECTDLDQLEAWLERAVTAESIDDLFD